MAEFVERTFGALQTLLSSSDEISDFSCTSYVNNHKKWIRSTNFNEFIESISTATSKFEEETVIKKELNILKSEISDPKIKPARIKECLAKAIYCEMLGYSVPFVYIHCIKLAQQGSLQEKSMGYLAASLFFHEQHEFVVLLVNTIQKDLNSSNVLEITLALRAACDFINVEMVSTILPLIERLAKHPKDIVRKKVVIVLYTFLKKFPNMTMEYESLFPSLLCDQDPGVMAASLHIFSVLTAQNPQKYNHLLSILIDIQRQIINQKFPEDYQYHGISAPWIQVHLIQLITQLASSSTSHLDEVVAVIHETLEHSKLNCNIAFAIVYECMQATTCLPKCKKLLDSTLGLISKFLRSQNNNLRYAGLTVLGNIIQIAQPVTAAEHQATMVECLYHPDEALRRKTLDLLFKMTNSSNVEIICSKMIDYLSTTDDEQLKADLVNHIIELAEQYSPDLFWTLQTIHTLFMKGGQWIQPEVTFKFLRELQKNTGDEELDTEIRNRTVQLFFSHARSVKPPEGLIQITSWVLGEFASENSEVTPEMAMNELMYLAQLEWHSENTSVWILQGIIKLAVQLGNRDEVLEFLKTYSVPKSTEVKQLVRELKCLAENLKHFKPASITNVYNSEIDFTLSFLDSFVAEDLEADGIPYKNEDSTLYKYDTCFNDGFN